MRSELESTQLSQPSHDGENRLLDDAGLPPTCLRVADRTVLTRIDWMIGLVTAALTAAALSPVWTTSFGFLDDYTALYGFQTDPWPLRDGALLQGRPVVVLLDFGFFSFVHTIGELTLMRAFSVASLAVFAAFAFVLLRRLGFDRFPAWVFAVGMLWLPSTQVMASWAILLMGPLALVFSLLASGSLSRSLDGVLADGAGAILSVRRLLPAIALLSLALCTYQPAAMVYWPLMLLLLLAPARRSWSGRRLLSAAAVVGATGAAACATAYAVLSIGAALVHTQYTRTALVTDIGGKADYLWTTAFPRIFDPWSLTPRPAIAHLTALAFVTFLFLATGGGVGRRLAGLALFLAALPLSYLPSVVTAENWASARSLAAAFVVPLAATTLILQGLPRVNPWGAWIRLACAAAIGVLAFHVGYSRVSDYFAKPQHEELALARAQVRPFLANVRSPIVVVRSDYTNTLAPGFSYDEFGIPSTYAAWVPVSFTEILAHEKTSRWLPNVRLVDRSHLASLPAKTVVVDYGHLLDLPKNAVVYTTRGAGR